MKTDLAVDISALLGADRVIDPPGSLPQPAQRLDPSGPVRPHELELAVERLCLDSTSFRNLRERAGGDPDLIARLIVEIVEVHYPWMKSNLGESTEDAEPSRLVALRRAGVRAPGIRVTEALTCLIAFVGRGPSRAQDSTSAERAPAQGLRLGVTKNGVLGREPAFW